jgi:hypothetical protein
MGTPRPAVAAFDPGKLLRAQCAHIRALTDHKRTRDDGKMLIANARLINLLELTLHQAAGPGSVVPAQEAHIRALQDELHKAGIL